jgi:SNF2 family DNA or RNA helicase
VFCRFRHDLDKIRKVAESQQRRYGEVSGRQDDLVDSKFPPDVDVLGVQIQAGGAGIDLSAAAYCAYYTVGFSLGDYEQSLARTHRPGQTRSVTYYHLVSEGTVDSRVYAALEQRKDVVRAILDRIV